MKDTKIIGFVGGPGAGKSTLALELAGWMKRKRMNLEYVGEYPKDLTWDGSLNVLDDQMAVFGEQFHRFYRLYGQTEWIVTDAPLIIQTYYAREAFQKLRDFDAFYPFHEQLLKLIECSHTLFDTRLFKAYRGERKYVEAGRNQTEIEAKKIDWEIDTILYRIGVKVEAEVSTLEEVLDYVFPTV